MKPATIIRMKSLSPIQITAFAFSTPNFKNLNEPLIYMGRFLIESILNSDSVNQLINNYTEDRL